MNAKGSASDSISGENLVIDGVLQYNASDCALWTSADYALHARTRYLIFVRHYPGG